MQDSEVSGDIDHDGAVAEMLAVLELERTDGGWTGRTPDWYGDVLFGGVALAQSIAAATREAPDGKRLHSIHAHFLRPFPGGSDVIYRPATVKEGRTLAIHDLTAEHAGKSVLTMRSSFAADGDGYVYDLGGIGDDVAAPHDLPAPEHEDAEGPWDARWVGPTEPRADGTRASTHRHWFRLPGPLPDDVHLHTALLGYATDWTGLGGRPLHLDGDVGGMISLDHAAWFHRPARVDEWLFHDVHSLVNAGGRGLLRGVIRDERGHVVASAAQEMLLAVV